LTIARHIAWFPPSSATALCDAIIRPLVEIPTAGGDIRQSILGTVPVGKNPIGIGLDFASGMHLAVVLRNGDAAPERAYDNLTITAIRRGPRNRELVGDWNNPEQRRPANHGVT